MTGVGVLVGAAIGIARRWPLPRAAAEIDRRHGYRDQLRSALELTSRSSTVEDPFVAIAIRDAERLAADVRPALVVPIRFERAWAYAAALGAIAAGVGMFVPRIEWDHRASVSAADRVSVADARQTIATAIETTNQARADGIADAAAAKRIEALKELESELASGRVDPTSATSLAAKSLDDQAAAIDDAAASRQREADEARAKLAAAQNSNKSSANASDAKQDEVATDPSGDAELRQALSRGDLTRSAEAARALKDAAQGASPAQREKWASQLEELAKAMESEETNSPTLPTDAPTNTNPDAPNKGQAKPAATSPNQPKPKPGETKPAGNGEKPTNPSDQHPISNPTERSPIEPSPTDTTKPQEPRTASERVADAMRDAARELREHKDTKQSADNQEKDEKQNGAQNPTNASKKPDGAKPQDTKPEGTKSEITKQSGKPDPSTPDSPSPSSSQPQPANDGNNANEKQQSKPEAQGTPAPSNTPNQNGETKQNQSGTRPDPSSKGNDRPTEKTGQPASPAQGTERDKSAPDSTRPAGSPDQGTPSEKREPATQVSREDSTNQPYPKPGEKAANDPAAKPGEKQENAPTQPNSTRDPKQAEPKPAQGSDSKSGAHPTEKASKKPNEQPTSTQPSNSPNDVKGEQPQPTPQADPNSTTPPPLPEDAEGLERLARELEKIARDRKGDPVSREKSESMRRQAEEMLEKMSPDQRKRMEELAQRLAEKMSRDGTRPQDQFDGQPEGKSDGSPGTGFSTSGPRAAPTPANRAPWTGETRTVDARVRKPGPNNDERTLAELARDEGRRTDAGVSTRPLDDGLREAAKGAERAIEEQSVPSRHADYVRRVFGKYLERASGTPSSTSDAKPPAKPAQLSPDAKDIKKPQPQ
jgi:hypothetical protein